MDVGESLTWFLLHTQRAAEFGRGRGRGGRGRGRGGAGSVRNPADWVCPNLECVAVYLYLSLRSVLYVCLSRPISLSLFIILSLSLSLSSVCPSIYSVCKRETHIPRDI